MHLNELPRYDDSDNPTGCCPRFDPTGWDGQQLHLKDRRFLRATTRSIAHIPVDMGQVFGRVLGRMRETGAYDPHQFLVLSRSLSAFQDEHLFAVSRDVPGEEMVTLSGDFLTRAFDGPYREARHWADEMKALAKAHGRRPAAVWFFYTTCPKCAKAYGHNPVVGLVELAPETAAA